MCLNKILYYKYFVLFFLFFLMISCAKQAPDGTNFGEKPYNYEDIINHNISKYMKDHHSEIVDYNYYIALDSPEQRYISKDLYGWYGRIAVESTYDDSKFLLIEYYIKDKNIVFRDKYSTAGAITKFTFGIATLGISQLVTGDMTEERDECISIITRIKAIKKELKEKEKKIEEERERLEQIKKEQEEERKRQYAIKHLVPHRSINCFKVKHNQSVYYNSFYALCTADDITIYDIQINKGNLKPIIKLPLRLKYGNTFSFNYTGNGHPLILCFLTNKGISSFDFSHLF